MKTSKSIERLFQEGLKDFEASPSPKVWSGIEDKLAGRKQPKRILPFWWQVASVAAILVIFSFIGAFYYNSPKSGASVSSQGNLKIESTSNSFVVIPAQYRFASVYENLSIHQNSIESGLAFNFEASASSLNFEQTSTPLQDREADSAEETRIADRSFATVNRLMGSSINLFSNSPVVSTPFEINKDIQNKKKSLFDAIKEVDLLAMEEDKTIDKPWAIQPNLAPVFMNSFNGGNPIEPSLKGKTSSNPNVSYGVNVAYAINKRIKIRTGVSQVAMGYNTQDVMLSVTSSSFRAGNSGNLNLEGNLVGDFSLVSASNNSNTSARTQTSSFVMTSSKLNPVGVINHELGFVEVPLEVEYALIDKKIGVHILGGASTFLLNNNEVFFDVNGRSSSIGEAGNLNTFSFSANLGVGMDYNFSERVSFNLEPKFMYQINTFKSNTTNFQPYFFGIYSGIKFKF
ncbi:hypothetical protein LB456_05805 [Psychroflexus sp. CAK57W]|uniref:hypothetical protein n=1 Tax=Psychroflexus curvus TaxID=2873595 RepID=UPI001CC9732F|nr:hypothetical protein [Psychroflexus curvus]MBZ9786969.1 hypothetical protein [Psychroflexus curvus]